MNFRVLILGSNSAIPAFGRFPSAQLVQYFGDSYLVDCGEGLQFRLSSFKVKRSKIKAVFISHLHGDHIFGLPGFLTSMSLSGHDQPIKLFGPAGLKKFVDIFLTTSQSVLRFPLIISELEDVGGKVFETDKLEIIAFPLQHRITTFGYIFREKPKKNRIDGDALNKYNLAPSQIAALMQGEKIWLDNETILDYNQFVIPPPPSCSYAYCSDTIFDPSIVPYIKKVNLLYHEATFSASMGYLAKERFHSTSSEAGKIALFAEVDKLLIGHFSSRYHDLNILLEEARAEFPNTYLAKEGEWFDIN